VSVDFGCIAWHEDGRWSATTLASTRDIGAIIDELKAQQTNGGAIALIGWSCLQFLMTVSYILMNN